jgi:serine/threonine protein kinase
MEARHLASGSYGDVYELRRQAGAAELRPSAAKVFKGLRSTLHTVLREMILLRHGEGPSIRDTLVDKHGGLAGYTMPLAETTLTSLVDSMVPSGAWKLGDVETLLKDCAESLEALHACGLTHGDVKGSNVLILGHGAVLSDFGMACRPAEGRADAQYTITYRPPEMLLEKTCGPSWSTDVWALGVTMHNACLGERVLGSYTADTAYAALREDFLDHGNQLEAVLEARLLARWPNETLSASRLARSITACLDCNPLKRPRAPSAGLCGCPRDRIALVLAQGRRRTEPLAWASWSYKPFQLSSEADALTGAPKTQLSVMQRETVHTVARNLSSLVHVRAPGVGVCALALAELLSKHFKSIPFIQRAVGAAYLSLLLWTPQESGLQSSVLARLASTSVPEFEKTTLQFLLVAVTDHHWASRWLQP